MKNKYRPNNINQVNILKIDDLNKLKPGCGCAEVIDFLLIPLHQKELFSKHDCRGALIPILSVGGKILYYEE